MRTVSAAVVSAALAALGCGRDTAPTPPDFGGEDGRQIAVVIELLSEDAALPKLRRVFAPGSTLTRADEKKYGRYRYDLKGVPEVTDATATATVNVIAHATGDRAGEQVWTFVKDGERWKIKYAPVP